MKKKYIILVILAALAAGIVVAAVLLGPSLKSAISMAQSANMSQEDMTAKNEENAQITQEMQTQYEIPEIEVTQEIKEAVAGRSMTLEAAATQLLADEKAKQETESAAQEPEPVAEPEAPATPEPVTEEPSTPETPVTDEPSEPVTPEPEPSVTPEPAPETPVTEEPPKPVTQEPEPVAEPEAPATPEPSKEDDGDSEAAQLSAVDPEEAARNERVQNLFVRLYVLRDAFDVRIENLVQECIDEFLALEPEQQTNSAKVRIVYSRIKSVQDMEQECDAEVEPIFKELDELDPGLGDKARQYYKNEKELKKANLIARYTGKSE